MKGSAIKRRRKKYKPKFAVLCRLVDCEDDFGPDGYEVRDCDAILRWALKNITLDKLTEEHPKARFMFDSAMMAAVAMAIDWAREKIARKCSEMVME